MTTATPPSLALPGQLLGPSSRYRAGPGTHIHESNLYSSLLGAVSITQPAKPAGPTKRPNKIVKPGMLSSSSSENLPTISVQRRRRAAAALPEVGDVVLCRVTRVSHQQAIVAILVVGDAVLDAEWQGVIRVRDVRATEKDRVKIGESFRPGDIVRAQVVCFLFLLLVCPDKRPCAFTNCGCDNKDLTRRPGQLLPYDRQQ
ncbi:hypothetical protein MCOR25_000791 [Pyricularia grisea]|nr:hypothetical protein MCOR25_000791 [Pyricularia grisea]